MFNLINYKNVIKKFRDTASLKYQKNRWGKFFLRCDVTITQSNKTKNKFTSAIVVDFDDFIDASQPIPDDDPFFISTQYAIYKGYPLHPKTGQPIKNKPLTIKMITGVRPQELEAELKRFGRYHKAVTLVQSAPMYFLIAEYLPGEPLIESTTLNQKVAKLSLSGKSNLLFQYANIINLLHHNTLTTGPALALRDIKGENTLVAIDPATERVDVSLTNYSAAIDMNEVDPNATINGIHSHCALAHMSPEAAKSIVTLKNDIYASEPNFTMPLGAINPFARKDNLEAQFHATQDTEEKAQILGRLAGARFNLNGLGSELPDHPVDIKPTVMAFAKRMGAFNASDRPDSDELLRFTTAYNIFCKTLEIYQSLKASEKTQDKYEELIGMPTKEDLENTLHEQAIKMAIVAGGFLHAKLGNKPVEVLPKEIDTSIQDMLVQSVSDDPDKPKAIPRTTLQQAIDLSKAQLNNVNNSTIIPITFEGFDFSKYHFSVKSLNLLHQYDLFTGENLKLLLNDAATKDSPVISMIHQLVDENLISKSILKPILERPETCSLIKSATSKRIACLFIIGDDESKERINNLTQKEKFNYLHYLLINREKILKLFGDRLFQNVYEIITKNLLEPVTKHLNELLVLSGKKWPHTVYSLWHRHSIGNEITAISSLRTAIESGDFSDYLSDANRHNRTIIAQSNPSVFGMFTKYFAQHAEDTIAPGAELAF